MRLSRGESTRRIGRALGRSPSTISEEIARNRLNGGEYVATQHPRCWAIHAQGRCQARKRKGRYRQPLKDEATYSYVLGKLREGWSPEQVAGRLARERGEPVISYETIYRYIYSEEARPLRLW